ncbi:acyl carrier protein [Nordella sp. HKS 07]|uniref:acyl carrier protein n=1 Tax=Nordella sp. HKS 07 TaxID=2712222 RepID=UPI0013E1F8BC|nr:phosphopantetheine-binding protein [Nordella sp. HKS 07]QIG46541.1 acyl carrier protein [Nordella sp. HKS 07]
MSVSEDTFNTLCQLLEPFNTAKIALKPDTDISADLNIDSVTVMDFVMEVEDRFNIDIPLNVLSETRSLGDLVKVVDARLAKV